jgi:hypothetical protein
MAREYDVALLESVALRRNRIRESLLWGRQRRARAMVDNVTRLGVGVVLAAAACAGCVGWSFVQHTMPTLQPHPSTNHPSTVTVPR